VSAAAWVAVPALGGAAAVARFGVDALITARARGPFPLGVLTINLAGTLVLGIAAGAALGGEALTIFAGGLIGSFTTFSGWMLDTGRLADEGFARIARLNAAASLVLGFAAIALGHWLGAAL
jgi:CrcB protein